jgi:hypothetical protein
MSDLLEVAPVEKIEDAEIEEEGIVGLAGEGRASSGHRGDRLIAQPAVVRHRGGAHVGRGHHGVGDQLPRLACIDPGQRVRLIEVERRVAHAVHRPGVVEEGAGVAVVIAEGPSIGDVRPAAAGVVDVQVVLGVGRE